MSATTEGLLVDDHERVRQAAADLWGPIATSVVVGLNPDRFPGKAVDGARLYALMVMSASPSPETGLPQYEFPSERIRLEEGKEAIDAAQQAAEGVLTDIAVSPTRIRTDSAGRPIHNYTMWQTVQNFDVAMQTGRPNWLHAAVAATDGTEATHAYGDRVAWVPIDAITDPAGKAVEGWRRSHIAGHAISQMDVVKASLKGRIAARLTQSKLAADSTPLIAREWFLEITAGGFRRVYEAIIGEKKHPANFRRALLQLLSSVYEISPADTASDDTEKAGTGRGWTKLYPVKRECVVTGPVVLRADGSSDDDPIVITRSRVRRGTGRPSVR